MKIKTRVNLMVLVLLSVLTPLSAEAEEGANGHYMPGGMASFIDTLPGKPGLAIGNFFNYYDGSASQSQPIPVAGFISGGLDATAYSNTVLALYQTSLRLLGGNYAWGVAIPYVRVEAKGEVRATGPEGQTVTRNRTDRADGIGDILIYPLMIGWTAFDHQLKCDVRLGVYAPTGGYDKNDLANVGKNYWTFEPTVSLSYMSSKNFLEVSAFAGMDFNTENDDTDYQSGDQFHLDIVAAKHFPLFGGLAGVGANFFYYQQINADSGPSTPVIGDFKGRTIGIGPVVSYITKAWSKDLVAELKWLSELDVSNRLEGDSIWFKVGMSF